MYVPLAAGAIVLEDRDDHGESLGLGCAKNAAQLTGYI